VYGEAYYFGDGRFLKIIVLPAPGPIKMRDQKRSVRKISRELGGLGVVTTSLVQPEAFLSRHAEKRKGIWP
jgi:hypothetical protein